MHLYSDSDEENFYGFGKNYRPLFKAISETQFDSLGRTKAIANKVKLPTVRTRVGTINGDQQGRCNDT